MAKQLLKGISKAWLLIAIVILILIISPLFPIFIGFLNEGNEVWDSIKSSLLTKYIRNTLSLTFFTLLVSLVIGVSSAWLVAMFDFPLSRFFRWSLILPIAIPSYIAAYIWSYIFSYTGPVTLAINALAGEMYYIDIVNIYYLSAILGLVLYPYIFIASRSSFESLSGYYNIGASLGLNNSSIFRKIFLPLAKPAIIGGATLVIMEILNDYGAAEYFGVNTFTVGIFRIWFSYGDLAAAIKLASYLLILVAIIIIAEKLLRGKAAYYSKSVSTKYQKIKLNGVKSVLATTYLMIIFAVAFIIPFFQIIVNFQKSLNSNYNFEILTTLGNTFLLSSLSVLILILFSVLIAYNSRVNKLRLSAIISRIAITGYSVPGAIIAIGVIYILSYISSNLLNSSVLLTGSILALVYANSVRFLAVMLNNMESGFTSVNKHIDETAYSLGFSTASNLIKNVIPLSRRFIFAAVIIGFIDISKELPLTLILRPFNFETLATNSYRFASEEMLVYSAVPSFFLILLSVVAVYYLNKFLYKKV